MMKIIHGVLATTSIAAFLLGLPEGSRAEAPAALVKAAKAEGELTVIALPHDWCGYGNMLDGFKTRYGIKVNEIDPDAHSGDEIEAIKVNKGNRGSQAPDVVDVGLAYGAELKAEGLAAPYRVSTWDSIPANQKDPDGTWYGDYYGVLVFEVNKDTVASSPTDWPDLLKDDYAYSVALGGDPRVAAQGMLAVYAAGLSSTKGDATKVTDAGLDFFAKLNKVGNFVPHVGSANSLAQGTTSIIVRWDYNALADRDALKGSTAVDIVVPKTGIVGSEYVQAISAFAPHPNAARLWMEYLYSDEGQLTYLKAYCHPIRFNTLVKENKIPPDLMAKLPQAEPYARAKFPTVAEQDSIQAAISAQWYRVVDVAVK